MISLFVAAAVGSFAYTKLGRRVGYGNSQQVWTLVAVAFIFTFAFMFSLLSWVIHLN
jgi:hypothetical protein